MKRGHIRQRIKGGPCCLFSFPAGGPPEFQGNNQRSVEVCYQICTVTIFPRESGSIQNRSRKRESDSVENQHVVIRVLLKGIRGFPQSLTVRWPRQLTSHDCSKPLHRERALYDDPLDRHVDRDAEYC